jgi:hypothetical protein
LIIRQVVRPLQNNNFEQHYAIIRRSACITFSFANQCTCDSRTETFPINHVQPLKAISEFA